MRMWSRRRVIAGPLPEAPLAQHHVRQVARHSARSGARDTRLCVVQIIWARTGRALAPTPRMAFVKLKQVVAILLCACLLFSGAPTASAQTASTAEAGQSGGDPWPRVVTVQGAAISIFQPQLESWTGTQLDAYAAVTIKPRDSRVTNYGVIWFTA